MPNSHIYINNIFYILIIKPTRCTNFSNLFFWNKSLHVSDSSSVHHQEFFTVHTATVYVMQVCWQLASRIRTELVSCSQAVNKPVWHIPLLCVQWKTPDDGQRNSPKHVDFYLKKEKLVHLVGFIIRIYHDARSPERQFITMHGHLNVNLSRCTVTWTSICHDARSPERQILSVFLIFPMPANPLHLPSVH
jgi:hypothetical protein